MPIATYKVYSSLPYTDYSMANDCVGQVKNILLSTGLVEVISDDNPPPTTPRNVYLKIGKSLHYVCIRADKYSYEAIGIGLRNLANTTDLESWGFIINNTIFKLLYGVNNLVLITPDSRVNIIYLNLDDNSGCIALGAYPSQVYVNTNDIHHTLIFPNAGAIDLNSRWICLPAFIRDQTGVILPTTPVAAFATSGSGLTQWNFYRDEMGNYYVCTDTSALLVSDK